MENLFEPIQAAPDEGNMDVLPAGDYRVVATNSQVKETKSRTGRYVEMEFTLQDAPYSGRKVWGRYTIQNQNDQAVQIGRRQLGALADACGLEGMLTNPSQLIGRSCIVSLAVKDDPQYGKSNEVKRTKSVGGAQQAPTTSQQAAPTPSPSSGSAPWEQ